MGRKARIGALALAIALLTGCTPVVDTSIEATDTEPPATCDPAAVTDEEKPYGAVIIKEPVTDDAGTYCQTTLPQDSALLAWDEGATDTASLEQYDITEGQALAAQQTAAMFLAEVGLDSNALDMPVDNPAKWLRGSPELRDPEVYVDALEEGTKLSETGLVATDWFPAPLPRASVPRAESTDIGLSRLAAFESNGTGAIVAEFDVDATYRVPNDYLVQTYLGAHDGETEEGLKDKHPELFGDEQLYLRLTGVFAYSVVPGEADKIAGSRSQWSLSTGTGIVLVE